jgi:multimeric flavodoxin WrbA
MGYNTTAKALRDCCPIGATFTENLACIKELLMILLNIQTSPRGSKSISTAATDAFVDAYRTAHPDVTVDNLNVWEEGLPEFDSEAIGAKYKGVSKEAMSDAESAIWKSIQSLAARFQAADLIVLGVPMWNFAYPYKLKQLIDLVSGPEERDIRVEMIESRRSNGVGSPSLCQM